MEPRLHGTVLPTTEEILATPDPLLEGVVFTPQQVNEVTEFMKALTDPAARKLRRLTPGRGPTGGPLCKARHGCRLSGFDEVFRFVFRDRAGSGAGPARGRLHPPAPRSRPP
jgi:hypothetical protein